MADYVRGSLSRRDFLKGSLASVLGVAGMVTLGGLSTGVAYAENEEKKASDAQIEKTFRIYETDVLVIGGGLSGTTAAYTALQKNVSVLIVDKGPYGHSGTSGINWGTWFGVGATKGGSGTLASGDGLVDQVFEQVIASESENIDVIELGTKAGIVYGRDAEGNMTPPTVIAQHFMPRLYARYVKDLGAKVLERVMITELLTAEDGSACGAVGFDIVGGEAVVIRAKSVVMATGSSCWVYGWYTAGPKSNAGLECTGDGAGILFNHGVKMRNFENTFLYGYNCYPDGIAYSQNVGTQASDHPYNVFDENGRYFMKEAAEANETLAANMSSLTYFKVLAAEIEAGNLSKEGDYYLDIPDMDSIDWQTFNRGRVHDLERAFDIDYGGKVKMRITPYSMAVHPEMNPETCETSIPGLFFANEGEDGVWPSGWCAMTGSMSGKNAADIAKKNGIKAAANEDLIAAIAAIYDAYERVGNDGLRPIEIEHEIQRVTHEKAFMLSTEESLTEAIAELQRIMEEDIPKMRLADDSRNFNNDWKLALEVPFLWQNAMAIATARLNRRETRGSHFRADFPEIDNENYLKNIYISQDGTSFSAEYSDVVSNGMTADEIEAALVDIREVTEAIRNK